MWQRRIRAAARGDDWGCCPAKPVRLVRPVNVTSVHYKNSQTANENPDVPYSTVRALWNGAGSGRAPNSSTDPVTAAAGLNAAGSTGTCSAPIYAVVASLVITVALIIALVAIIVRRRRRRRPQHSSPPGSSGGGGQWNKKLVGILTPGHRNLLHQQSKSTSPRAGYDDAKSPNTTSTTVSPPSSSRRALTSNQRHGYTPLPGTVFPAATRRQDPNPYNLPTSQCSYQPQRVKFVTLKRRRTIDSQTGDVDAGDNDEKELSPSRKNVDVDSEIPTTSNLQALLPLNSLRSLFGVVGGVFGVAPAFAGAQQLSVVDRRASTTVLHTSMQGVDRLSASAASPAAHLEGGRINDAKAGLRRDSNATQPVNVSSDMGANASADQSLSGSGLTGTTPPMQSSPNDFESLGSGNALDDIQATSMATIASATQSAGTSDLDVAPTGSDDAVSFSTQSLRQSITEKWSVDSDMSTRRQSAQSTGSTTCDIASRQTSITLGRIGGLADALGLGDLMRSVTGNQPTEAEKVEPFWVPPGLQIQKQRAHSLQSSLPVSEFEASNGNI